MDGGGTRAMIISRNIRFSSLNSRCNRGLLGSLGRLRGTFRVPDLFRSFHVEKSEVGILVRVPEFLAVPIDGDGDLPRQPKGFLRVFKVDLIEVDAHGLSFQPKFG